ncbi:zinc finger protein 62 homolog isoform X1 [Pectinophora gossypiella]|uniref:zinc finger protein 62 homolog isoform X1 n=1 Tax=Pectinophora gossypiella TaxID=13191 RepID=UPI00214E8BD0|nr:zinc finger protein 62 homolog isoform X1 [Pectinophora gossypiella]
MSRKSRSCRICLVAKPESRVSFNIDSEWFRLFEYCFGVSASIKKGPKILCGQCSKKLKDYSDFKTIALKSDVLWNNIVSNNVKVKKDRIENIETIEIKSEGSSNHAEDTEYLEWNTLTSIDAEFKEQDNEEKEVPVENVKVELLKSEGSANHAVNTDYIKWNTLTGTDTESKQQNNAKKQEKEEKVTVEGVSHPTKKSCKKERKDGLPESLTQNQLIKKYFEIDNSIKGPWKTKYICLKCGEEYKRKDALPTHVQKCYKADVQIRKDSSESDKVRLVPNTFYCGLCDFTSLEEHVVTEHLNGHFAILDLACKSCEYVGRDIADMVYHRYKHMPQDFKYKYICPACNKPRMNALSLQYHYRSLHLKKDGGWCSVCGKTFKDYRYFRNHERLHKVEKYICDICGMKFLFRNLIITHLKEHLNIRNYICDTCGKSFKRNNALTGHIRAFHTVNKAVICDHCGKKYKNRYNLRLHMKMVNKGKKYICDVCSKGYATLNLLEKHMFWHTGEKPFECETCGLKYKAKSTLKIHKRKHAGYFPYQCTLCEKAFISLNQLKVHTSVHTGIRRVKCLVCDKTFHEKKRMLDHCRSKHESVMIKTEAQTVVAAPSSVPVVLAL